MNTLSHDKMRFLIDRINEINEWRREAVLHAVERIDARVLYQRQHAEK